MQRRILGPRDGVQITARNFALMCGDGDNGADVYAGTAPPLDELQIPQNLTLTWNATERGGSGCVIVEVCAPIA